MRKALVIGIDHYENQNPLYGCVNDAHRVNAVLERHGNGTINFDVQLLTATSEKETITKSTLKKQIIELFKTEDDAVFYFSGHGHLESTGGYLLTSECKNGDEGMPTGWTAERGGSPTWSRPAPIFNQRSATPSFTVPV